MSWIISRAVLVHSVKRRVIYPWEYSIQWDIANHELVIYGTDDTPITTCSTFDISYKQFAEWHAEGLQWKDLTVEIESDALPGNSSFKLNGDQLTNGIVTLHLSKCEVADVDDVYFGLSCNGTRYLVKRNGEAQRYLVQIIDVLKNAQRGKYNVSVESAESPGSSSFLNFIAWTYAVLGIVFGMYMVSKTGEIAVGFGIGLGVVLVLAFALALSKINDNLQKVLARKA